MFRRAHTSQRGFTLLELLTSIAIISVLMALLLVAVSRSRAAARRLECMNNLKQFGLAMQSHHDHSGHFPSGIAPPVGWGWGALLLPYLDQGALHTEMGVAKEDAIAPDSGTDLDVSLGVFVCPTGTPGENYNYRSQGASEGYQKSSYVAVNGNYDVISQSFEDQGNGIFGMCSKTTISEVTDGLSHTFAVGERHMDKPGFRGAIWMRAINFDGTYIYGPSVMGTCGKDYRLNAPDGAIIGFSSRHSGGGAQFLMADGSARFISETIDITTYMNLAEKDDSQTIDLF